MKWFSAVVLSLLFCFVKSLKSRAIRTHLKNGMAHGEAMRARTGTRKTTSTYAELKKRVVAHRTKTDVLKQQVDDPNTYGTSEFPGELMECFVGVEEIGNSLQKEIDNIPDTDNATPIKAELNKQLNSSLEAIEDIGRTINTKKFEQLTNQLEKINTTLENLKLKIEGAAAKKMEGGDQLEWFNLKRKIPLLFPQIIEDLKYVRDKIEQSPLSAIRQKSLRDSVDQAHEMLHELIGKFPNEKNAEKY
eukprot:Platyproteum_vivax@DN2687_c0_g2_i1.p1